MPKIETITRALYMFNDLTEDEKRVAINNLWDINIFHDWWDYFPGDFALDDVRFYFDLGRSRSISIRPAESIEDTARHIVDTHANITEQYKRAKEFIDKLTSLVESLGECENDVDEDILEGVIDDLKTDFWDDLAQIVLHHLRRDYEYLTSEEGFIETLESKLLELRELRETVIRLNGSLNREVEKWTKTE